MAYACGGGLAELNQEQSTYELAGKAREVYRDDPLLARTLGIIACKRAEHTRTAILLKEASPRRADDA